MAWSWDGNDSEGGSPYPAVALAPRATICAEPPRMVANKTNAVSATIQAILVMRLFPKVRFANVGDQIDRPQRPQAAWLTNSSNPYPECNCNFLVFFRRCGH